MGNPNHDPKTGEFSEGPGGGGGGGSLRDVAKQIGLNVTSSKSQKLDEVQMSYYEHLAKGGSRSTFVSPHSDVKLSKQRRESAAISARRTRDF